MLECKICGKEFELTTDIHYVSRDNSKPSVILAVSGSSEDVIYDTFDCPHCGCQYVAQERKREFYKELDCVADDVDVSKVHDGCAGCKYEMLGFNQEPCNVCSGGYLDKYEKYEYE